MELSKWLHVTKNHLKNLSQVQIIYNSLMQVLNEKLGINEISMLCIYRTPQSLTFIQYLVMWNFSMCHKYLQNENLKATISYRTIWRRRNVHNTKWSNAPKCISKLQNEGARHIDFFSGVPHIV